MGTPGKSTSSSPVTDPRDGEVGATTNLNNGALRAPASLRRLAAQFLSEPTARTLLPAIAGAALLRARRGRLRVGDLAVATLLVGSESATEWVVHRDVLHRQTIPIGGRTLRWHPGEAHARHHEFPDDPTTVPIGPIGMLVAVSGVSLVALPPGPMRGPRATAALTALSLLLNYEWIHFLIHTEHQARHRWFERLRQGHLAHHFVDPNTWYGITGHAFDRLMGTAPPLTVTH